VCDLECAEAGGTKRRGGWGTGGVAMCNLVCAKVVLAYGLSGATLVHCAGVCDVGVGF